MEEMEQDIAVARVVELQEMGLKVETEMDVLEIQEVEELHLLLGAQEEAVGQMELHSQEVMDNH
jgi:hypothetical protein